MADHPQNPHNLQQSHIEFCYQIVLHVFRLEVAELLFWDEKTQISEQVLTQTHGAPYHTCIHLLPLYKSK